MRLRRFANTLLLLISFTPAHAAFSDVVTICWESGLKPPYLELDKKNNPTGLVVKRLENILDAAHIEYKHILLPWTRCLTAAEEGKADLVPNASYKDERAEYALYSDVLYATSLSLYYVENNFESKPNIPDALALSQYRVGGIRGFNYSFYKGVVKPAPLVTKRKQLIHMLKRGRIDFAVLQKQVTETMAANNGLNLEGLASIPDPVFPSKQYHILISKKSADSDKLLNVINEGLKQTGWQQ